MNLIKIKKVGTGHQIKQNKKKILRTFKEGTCTGFSIRNGVDGRI